MTLSRRSLLKSTLAGIAACVVPWRVSRGKVPIPKGRHKWATKIGDMVTALFDMKAGDICHVNLRTMRAGRWIPYADRLPHYKTGVAVRDVLRGQRGPVMLSGVFMVYTTC